MELREKLRFYKEKIEVKDERIEKMTKKANELEDKIKDLENIRGTVNYSYLKKAFKKIGKRTPNFRRLR